VTAQIEVLFFIRVSFALLKASAVDPENPRKENRKSPYDRDLKFASARETRLSYRLRLLQVASHTAGKIFRSRYDFVAA